MVVQQTRTVKGLVSDELGPVAGATVIVKGTQNGVITNVNGEFTLSGVKVGDVIEVSYIGYATLSVKYNGEQRLSLQLKEDSQQLGEVVVTALGIKREKKALGYSMQEVKGADILQARETNVANALSGKVSGLQIIRSGNGPGSSSKIQLRGNNSLTGLNQPLIVVDGIPMENFTGAANNDFWNPSADMGNGISDISSDDIASMSVLKGASAAALYGSRAGNGVILITTKSGRKTEGLGVTISGTVSAETIFMSPKMQNSLEWAETVNRGLTNLGNNPFVSDLWLQHIKDYMADPENAPNWYPDPNGYANAGHGNFNYCGNVDYMDAVYDKTALMQQHTVSLQGGTEKMKYYTSIGSIVR